MEDQEKRTPARTGLEYVKQSLEATHTYAWVWRELVGKGVGRHVVKFTAVSVVNSAVFLAVPLAIAVILDAAVAHDFPRLVRGFVALVALYLVGTIASYAYDWIREYAIGEVIGRLERRASELFFGKSLGQHLAESGRLSAAGVERGYYRAIEMANVLMDAVPMLAEIVVVYGLLWWLSPWLGLAATVLLANHLVWSLFINRRISVEADAVEEDWRNMSRYRTERWENVERVKTSGRERKEREHLIGWFGRVIAADRHLWLWVPKATAGRTLVGDLITLGGLAYGLYLVWQGQFTIGAVYPLYSWLSIFGRRVVEIGRVERRLNWNAPAVRSMMETLTVAPEVTEKPDAVPVPDTGLVRVEVEGLTHRYGAADDPKAPPPVLSGVSFTVEPGEKVALLGPSGAGKTTVMRLLQRYCDPTSGSIRVNGVDLRDLRLDSWREMVGYVPQSPQVLDGSVRYNLAYAAPEGIVADDESLWAMMRSLAIDFGARLTEGLETKVGRRGLKLSGGQAQRLMIGAAVAKSPKFLIVDEATSSLDSTTEREVQAGLVKAMNGHVSALVIAHRLSTVRDMCDKFVVLKPTEAVGDGESQVEAVAGSFEELYRVSPTFRRLADDQGLTIA
jgi:ATP-binding cassette subfamily B protein